MLSFGSCIMGDQQMNKNGDRKIYDKVMEEIHTDFFDAYRVRLH